MSKENKEAIDYLNSIRDAFQSCSNDSIFISTHGDVPYRLIYFVRGDQSEDIEEAIFDSKEGDVVGPFHAGTHNYLFKIIKLDSIKQQWKIHHLFLKPLGKNSTDTLENYNKAQKLLKQIKRGDNIANLASHHHASEKDLMIIGLDKLTGSGGRSGWIWEGKTQPQFDEALSKARIGETIHLNSSVGSHIFQLNDKKSGYYKAIVVSIVKKTKK